MAACAESESVVVTASRGFATGGEVSLNDARPNGERLLATGAMQPDNAANFLTFEAELVRTDRLYSSKRDVLQSMGIEVRCCYCSCSVCLRARHARVCVPLQCAFCSGWVRSSKRSVRFSCEMRMCAADVCAAYTGCQLVYSAYDNGCRA